MWRPEASSVRAWREDTIYLGRIASSFQIRLHSERSEGRGGDVALDQLEFLDCALPRETLRLQLLLIIMQTFDYKTGDTKNSEDHLMFSSSCHRQLPVLRRSVLQGC